MARFKKVIWHGDKYTAGLEKNLKNRMNKVTTLLAGATKKMISVSGEGGPSKPGEPPHRQTGTLLNSITFVPAKKIGNDVVGSYGAGASAPYAIYLEHGTSKIDARPFLSAVWKANESTIERILYGS